MLYKRKVLDIHTRYNLHLFVILCEMGILLSIYLSAHSLTLENGPKPKKWVNRVLGGSWWFWIRDPKSCKKIKNENQVGLEKKKVEKSGPVFTEDGGSDFVFWDVVW